MDNANKSGQWYTNILNKLHEFFRKYDLPEDMAGELQAIVIDVAREQYKVGNKAGIAWLKREQAKNGARSPSVTPTTPMVYSA